jgi:hypothetical protein
MADAPVQHTPKHQEGDVFDPRHPAASPFAPLQPGAGVVADDADERGQNLAGGPPASKAAKTHAGQREALAKQHDASLRAGVATAPAPAAEVKGATATPAKAK